MIAREQSLKSFSTSAALGREGFLPTKRVSGFRTSYTNFRSVGLKLDRVRAKPVTVEKKNPLIKTTKNGFTNFYSFHEIKISEIESEPTAEIPVKSSIAGIPKVTLPHTFADLLARELDRREFLAYLGSVLLALTGFFSLMRILSNPHGSPHNISMSSSNSGFGSGSYGG